MPSNRFRVSNPRTLSRRPRFLAKSSLALIAASLGMTCLHAGVPDNLGLGLRKLAGSYESKANSTGSTTLTHAEIGELKKAHPAARLDSKDRVLVDVYLNGCTPVDEAVRAFEDMGSKVVARADWYRHGALSVYVPLDQAGKLGLHPGVDTVNLSLKPVRHAGPALSQGVKVLKSDLVNRSSYNATNITVGVISDSFDTSQFDDFEPPATTAADDAADGDLPGPGNPDGRNTPVYVLQDYGSEDEPGSDEGRAMAQIVHDVAPGAPLAFATAEVSEIGFAQNIIALAEPKTQNVTILADDESIPGSDTGKVTVKGAGARVICDDVQYFDEPMFSDGILGQAVDYVANRFGVSYFSSAGNDGNSGYVGTYTPAVNNTANEALLATQGNIAYRDIPADERAAISSFHSFGTDGGGKPVLVQRIKVPLTAGFDYPGVFVFQWDDPFNATDSGGNKQVTTDYDVLVFSQDKSGATAFEPDLSGTEINGGAGGTNQPIELTGYFDADVQYEIVIVETNRKPAAGVTANKASHIRWAMQTDAAAVIATFSTPNSPNSYGHDCAASCNGTAAYIYDNGLDAADTVYHPQIEPYSSNGPAVVYFDAAGTRLSTPIVRTQPKLATVDGVDTSFFGSDSDGDGFPNFFGTSAASPHGAGCAAILIGVAQARGVTLTPAEVTSLLTTTTQGQADQDPALSQLTVGPVTLTARDRSTYTDPAAYSVSLASGASGALTQISIDQRTDTQPSPGYFVTDAFPLTLGVANGSSGKTPAINSFTLSNLSKTNLSAGQTLAVSFTGFTAGDSLSFGVASTNTGDALGGATVTATVKGTTYTGVLANKTGKGWNVKSGYGLVDVQAAVNKLLPTLPAKTLK